VEQFRPPELPNNDVVLWGWETTPTLFLPINKEQQWYLRNKSHKFLLMNQEPVVVMSKDSDFVSARVKGTWKMFWGTQSFDFVDGKRYNLPKELFAYLRANGNIYDTL